MKIIVVGGVAGGATAASRIRRLDESAEITIYEKSGYISYANCGLPYYLGDVIKDKESLTLQTPYSFKKRYNVDVFVNHEVINVDTKEKKVYVKNLLTNEIFFDSYDKLLLAPGSSALKPNIEGINSNKIFYLKNVEDTFAIEKYINENAAKDVVVVGGGFIGIEVSENLRHKGMNVTIVERVDQVLTFLDKDIASFAHNKLRQNGIDVILDDGVNSFSENDEKIVINTQKGRKIKADLIILSLGVYPNTHFLKDSNIDLDNRGYIVTNEFMQTNIDSVYAVGDAIKMINSKTNNVTVIPLAGPANKQARIAATNIVGLNKKEYKGTNGTSIVKIFDFAFSATGINEKTAKNLFLNYEKVVVGGFSHASYYPGAKPILIKVLFDKDSLKILGGQIIGSDGVDKRIDVLSSLIKLNASVLDLMDIDFAYAPPFGSAKDPLNMVGFIADNILDGVVKQYDLDKMKEIINESNKYNLIDLRTPYEYRFGSVPNFKNIPLDELRDRLGEIDFAKPIYVICQSGLRSYTGLRILAKYTDEVYNFIGGYNYYLANQDEFK